MPIFPHLFSFRDAEIRDDLRRRREKDWHRVVESIVIEDRPTRVAAHDLRPDRINNASNSGFTNGERAHRTGLDSRIERAPLSCRLPVIFFTLESAMSSA